MALRLGLFYTAASLSGAFGGLLARGIVDIGQVGKQANWSWIFIIEGLLVSFLICKVFHMLIFIDCCCGRDCFLLTPKQC